MNTKSKFYQDLSNERLTVNVNGNPLPWAMWNLTLSIRDVSLYTKGIKPNRFWKFTDVKNYFGVTGTAEKVLIQLKDLKNNITNN